MRLNLPSASTVQCAIAASLLSLTLSTAPSALADNLKGDFKIQGGGASTLQSGRRITITRGVNLDSSDWHGENLKGVAFQQSVVRSSNFAGAPPPAPPARSCGKAHTRCSRPGANLFSASFFDADLSNSNFKDANMVQCNLEMADMTNADLTNVGRFVSSIVL